MYWLDIAAIVVSCVLANHMGLVSAIERIFRVDVPILGCVKCSTFWFVFAFTMIHNYNVVTAVAISFLLSYLAIWLELAFGIIDKLYEAIYDKVYKGSTEVESSDNEDSENTKSSLP